MHFWKTSTWCHSQILPSFFYERKLLSSAPYKGSPQNPELHILDLAGFYPGCPLWCNPPERFVPPPWNEPDKPNSKKVSQLFLELCFFWNCVCIIAGWECMKLSGQQWLHSGTCPALPECSPSASHGHLYNTNACLHPWGRCPSSCDLSLSLKPPQWPVALGEFIRLGTVQVKICLPRKQSSLRLFGAGV